MNVGHEEVNAIKLKSKFHVEHVLGQGAFATVFKAHRHKNHKSSNIVALKIINLKRVANRRRSLRHKNSNTCSTCSFLSREDTERIEKRPNMNYNDRDVKGNSDLISVKEMVMREISVHREASKTRHPNIVALLDSFYYDLPRKTTVAALVMELCVEDLGSYLRRKKNERKDKAQTDRLLPESEVGHVLRHVLRGLAFLHSIGIAHRK